MNRNTVIGLTIITIITIILLTRFIQLLITRPINRAASIASEITKANLDNEINGHQPDEIGLLLTALDSMQANLNNANNKLNARIAEQQRLAKINGRIKQALDLFGNKVSESVSEKYVTLFSSSFCSVISVEIPNKPITCSFS